MVILILKRLTKLAILETQIGKKILLYSALVKVKTQVTNLTT